MHRVKETHTHVEVHRTHSPHSRSVDGGVYRLSVKCVEESQSEPKKKKRKKISKKRRRSDEGRKREKEQQI